MMTPPVSAPLESTVIDRSLGSETRLAFGGGGVEMPCGCINCVKDRIDAATADRVHVIGGVEIVGGPRPCLRKKT
jgi:hypothetical protein